MADGHRSHLLNYAIGGGVLLLALSIGVAAVKTTSFPFASVPTLSDEQSQIAEIQRETARLIGTRHTGALTAERAVVARGAIMAADYAKAEAIVADVLEHSRLQAWRFWPFTKIMENIVAINDDGFRQHLDDWVAARPGDKLPLLIRAQYFFETAWRRRGENFGSKLTNEQRTGFEDNIARASADIDTSIRAGGDDPYSQLLRLLILSAHGNTARLEAGFQAAISKFPTYYPLYRQRLAMLVPKWGGSVPAMYLFVDKYAGKVAADSPQRMLYLALYDYLLDTASGDCATYWSDPERLRGCLAIWMRRSTTPQLEEHTLSALNLYTSADKYQFSIELMRYLDDMVYNSAARINSGAILQLAADSTGTDLSLSRDASVRGNYVVDLAAGNVWQTEHFSDNAEKKYQHALIDMEAMAFPDDEARDLARGDLYDRLAALAEAAGQYVRAIAYTEAAISISGNQPNTKRYVECNAYFQLRLYQSGAKACTSLIDKGSGVGARYWRAKNNEALGNADAALSDFKMVADSDDRWGAGAAIEMSHIYGDKNDLSAMLAVLNRYPYLYDENSRTKNQLAIVYNNRCYAYMKLGDLQKAIADCSASLRFGSLPDAFAKQEQLVKLLKETGKVKPGSDGPI